ncbi:unnamed protein product [Clonostachys rosea]|uniref:Uncharacterized protein n=1 Tax=Bionectria ochroleuca TaxID=29856 RepID=A0ABY6TRW7_BIOOC|nr:unnamed protein product [Clonostachys rosea]
MAEGWTATAEEGHEEDEEEELLLLLLLLAGNGLGWRRSITPSAHGVSGGCRPAHPSPPLEAEPNAFLRLAAAAAVAVLLLPWAPFVPTRAGGCCWPIAMETWIIPPVPPPPRSAALEMRVALLPMLDR